MNRIVSITLLCLLALQSIAGTIGYVQPDPYITDACWSTYRKVTVDSGGKWVRTVLGTKELKDRTGDKLSQYGKDQLERVFGPLEKAGLGAHVTLEGEDYGCLKEIVANLASRRLPVEIDPGNEIAALQRGKPNAAYIARLKWLQNAIAGTRIRGLTAVCHGWFSDWLGTKHAETADFGLELQGHLNQVDYIYTPGSDLRNASGWAAFTTNCYVSRDVWNIRQALVTKARSILLRVRSSYNSLPIVFAEFGVWLPSWDVYSAYAIAKEVAAAAREVASWPGVSRVMIYAPVGDLNFQIVRSDATVHPRWTNGYKVGLFP